MLEFWVVTALAALIMTAPLVAPITEILPYMIVAWGGVMYLIREWGV